MRFDALPFGARPAKDPWRDCDPQYEIVYKRGEEPRAYLLIGNARIEMPVEECGALDGHGGGDVRVMREIGWCVAVLTMALALGYLIGGHLLGPIHVAEVEVQTPVQTETPAPDPKLEQQIARLAERSFPTHADRSQRPLVPRLYDYEGEAHALEALRRTREWEAQVAAFEDSQRLQRQREAAVAGNANSGVGATAGSGHGGSGAGDIWWRLALCESGGTNANTGNGYWGYYQFDLPTWRSVGGVGLPTDHGFDEQLHRAQVLHSRRGWSPWPGCSRQLGLK